jgi:hypothetical protein
MTLIGPDDKIDWFRVIIDLERSGYTISSVGVAINRPKSTILRWKQGSSLRYEDAVRLLDLWADVCNKSQDCVHTVNRYSHLA